MPRPPRHNAAKPKRLIFRDALGRFLKGTDRYTKKVKSVSAVRGGKYVKIIDNGDVTPKKLVDLVTREEFEALPAAYGDDFTFKAPKGKYKAWALAEQIVKTRGVKGKQLKITLEFSHGRQKRNLTLYFQPKKSATAIQNQTALWSTMTRALGMENASEYTKVGSRFLEDRRGTTTVKLLGAKIERLI